MRYKAAYPYKKQNKLPILRYSIYLFLITITLSNISLSRYTSSAAQSASARVGYFDVTVTSSSWYKGLENVFMAPAPDENAECKFTVTNNSEVPVRARLVIDSSASAAQSPVITPDGWFEVPRQESRDITVIVNGTFEGKNMQMHVEYEQID